MRDLLISQPAERVCQITLNRPRQLNALARQTILELHQALSNFETSSDDILLLTGSGRFFCFGADFLEFEDRDALPALLQSFQDLILRLYHCPRITVACLNGFATGAGLDLALACDFRLASDKCKVGEAYISMGLVPDGGGTFFLTRLLGPGRALELLATGDSIQAQEAQRLGILHRLYNSETLQQESIEFAKLLCEKPQAALRRVKKLVKSTGADLKTALEREREAQLLCFEDPDHQAILRDFLARRKDRKGN
jgi:2-(1,2-epoxy-1,2-dihydrophenyl)acetyl-CoA isomerase